MSVGNNLFIRACEEGLIDKAKEIYSLNKTHVQFNLNGAFQRICAVGHLDIVQWIYSLGCIDIHARNDRAFLLACHNGHLDVAQWLHSLGEINVIGGYPTIFDWVCWGNHTNVARWIYSLDFINALSLTPYLHRVAKENLDMLQFLLENGADVHCDNNRWFKKFILWENKLEVHQILLQYCKEEWYHLMDKDIIRSLLNPTKSARKI